MLAKFALLAATASVTAVGSVNPAHQSQAERDYYIESGRFEGETHGARLDAWEDALLAELRKSRSHSIDAAAASLARQAGMAQADMRQLITLWLDTQTLSDPREAEASHWDQLTDRFRALSAASNHNPLVLQAAAAAILQEGGCTPDRVKALAGWGEAGQTLPLIAEATEDCTQAGLELVRATPDKGLAPLLRGYLWQAMREPEAIPVLQYTVSPTGLAHFAPQDRAAAQLVFVHDLIGHLGGAGDAAGAIATFEAQDAAVRESLLAAAQPGRLVTVDEATIKLPELGKDGKPDRSLAITLAEAYFLADRPDAARAMLDRLNADKLRAAFECFTAAGPGHGQNCGKVDGDEIDNDLLWRIVKLDQTLRAPDADPYIFAEYSAGAFGRGEPGGTEALIDCRIYTDAALVPVCTRSRQANATDGYRSDAASEGTLSQIAEVVVPDFRQSAARRVSERTARFGQPGKESGQNFADRPAIEPAPLPWAAQPIPPQFTGKGPALRWSKRWAHLPEGFMPVRIEQTGQQVTVISLSQAIDPNGEVTAGGYWLHRSPDGGKSWQAPLYTGLADRFPYVVVPDAKLPLLDGTDLTLAVDEALIDTRSITYPPVGLRTLRSRKGLYLRIPLTDLQRDSNGDGLTDLAAQHLLLEGTGPLATRLDRTAPDCPADGGANSPMGLALQHIMGGDAQALFEPVDRAPNQIVGAHALPVTGGEHPLMLSGNPADFACLRLRMPIIVYGPEQLEAMRTHSPDFRTQALEPIVYNRAHNRAFLVWSTGWRGGTLVFHLTDGKWSVDPTSDWIT